ncbi:unnamed protein product [Amoebophrya sp. A25]|nr:unnamed protein product [Amoebophrya sp. A25]|eukprot:GSA25T00005998001.1
MLILSGGDPTEFRGEAKKKYETCFCCIPISAGVAALSAALFAYGMGTICLNMITWYRTEATLDKEPSTLTAHLAPAPVSCIGMRGSSYTLRRFVDVSAATFIGLIGILAILDNSGKKLVFLRKGLLLLINVHLFVFAWDFIYIMICPEYPLNVVRAMLVDGFLIGSRKQSELMKWIRYPQGDVNDLADTNVFGWYFLQLSAFCLFLYYIAVRLVNYVEEKCRGPLGLGEFYGLRSTHASGDDATNLFGLEERHPLTKPVDFWSEYGFDVGGKFYVKSDTNEFASAA